MESISYVASTSSGYVALKGSEISYVSNVEEATKFNDYKSAFEALDAVKPHFHCVVSEVVHGQNSEPQP